tara:strand:- start:585 stop:1115 length:531 start_codon:yes stop_codon:yes gene_type:complete
MSGKISDNLGRSSGLLKAAGGGGKIGQVLSVTQLAVLSTNATSWTDITGLTQAITPSASSSKILWNYNIMTGSNAITAHVQIVYGDASALTTGAIGNAYGDRIRVTSGGLYSDNTSMADHISMQGLDAPNTTSATTYKLQWYLASGYVYLNRRVLDTDNASFNRAISTLTLMEVLA